MDWIRTLKVKPPLKTSVIGYFNTKNFKGYAVCKRFEFKIKNKVMTEYQFDIPGENYGQQTGPLKWSYISIPT